MSYRAKYNSRRKYKTKYSCDRKNKPTYVYSINLSGGKKYVGLSENPNKRIADHFNGTGSKWTQKHKPISVNHIQKCKNYDNAKKAETIVYYKMKNYHGASNVRGAGHTKSF